MTNILLQVFEILFLCAVFAGLIFPLRGGNYFENKAFISKENTTVAKGIACVMVVFCHVTAPLDGPISLASNLGHLAVGLFFFCSGYGLIYNYFRRDDYLNQFFMRRFIPILIPWWCANVMFVLTDIFVYHQQLSGIEIFKKVSGIEFVCRPHWFIVTLLILYIAFYILGKLIANKSHMTILMIAFCIVYDIVVLIKNDWWGGTTLPFALGVILAAVNEKRLAVIFRKYKIFLSSVTAVFLISIFYYAVLRWHLPVFIKSVYYGAGLLSECFFPIVVFAIFMKIKIKSPLAKFLGMCSYEIYLIHQLVIDYANLFFQEGYLQVFLIPVTLLISILGGYLFYQIMQKIVPKLSNKSNFKRRTIMKRMAVISAGFVPVPAVEGGQERS